MLTPNLSKKNIQKLSAASALLFVFNIFLPFIVTAQESSTVGQHLDRGDFSIDTTPETFTLPSVSITRPNTAYKSYYNGFTDTNPLSIHDGRYSGGILITIQASDYDPETPDDASDDLAGTNLSVVTSNNSFTEVVKAATPAMSAPLDGDPSDDADYTSFTAPLVILDGAGGNPDCNIGRVGTYTTYPSFRLSVPNDTPAGTYTNTITYDLMEAPTGC